MIVLDVETSDTDPRRNSILSIGALDFSNPKNQFYMECRIMKNTPIDPIALKFNGFTKEEITGNKKKPPQYILKEFMKWTKGIEDLTLAGHNVCWDTQFLRSAFERCKLKSIFSMYAYRQRYVDTHTLVLTDYMRRRIKPPLENNHSGISFNEVLKYSGLPERPIPHSGLTDTKITAEVISRLLYGKNLLKEYNKFKIPTYLKKRK